MRQTNKRDLASVVKLLASGIVAMAAVVGGVLAEVHFKGDHDNALVAQWLVADALPYGGIMIEPRRSLELAATLDSPTTLRTVIEAVRRQHGSTVIATLERRFSLVVDAETARFDAPLMTMPEDIEGISALALFTEAVYRGVNDATAAKRDLASVSR